MKEFTQDQNFNGHRVVTAFHDADSKSIVIFCHGYRGTSVGPNRFFVTVARQLAKQGISSLRFDQYGSGNSEGDFFDSSFLDWMETTKAISENYLKQGYKVALFGQSMGGAAVIAVGSELPNLSAIIAWSPDPNVDKFIAPENGIIEESGQIVQARFWQEAHDAKVADKLSLIKTPMYIVQCTADEYVDEQNRNAISKNAQQNHKVENFEGYSHSKWTYEQSKEIIDRSINFLVQYLKN
ncbi:MAG: lysophospholipase [Patescibacteria group bacterium]|nr:lysophospholipase [Patescibacteria group bacterium]